MTSSPRTRWLAMLVFAAAASAPVARAQAQSEPVPATHSGPEVPPRWSDTPTPPPLLPHPAASRRNGAINAQAVLTVIVPTLLVDAGGRVICETRLFARLRVVDVPDGELRALTVQAHPLTVPIRSTTDRRALPDEHACARLRIAPATDMAAPASQLN